MVENEMKKAHVRHTAHAVDESRDRPELTETNDGFIDIGMEIQSGDRQIAPAYDFPYTWEHARNDSIDAVKNIGTATVSFGREIVNSGIGRAGWSIGGALAATAGRSAKSFANYAIKASVTDKNQLPRLVKDWVNANDAKARRAAEAKLAFRNRKIKLDLVAQGLLPKSDLGRDDSSSVYFDDAETEFVDGPSSSRTFALPKDSSDREELPLEEEDGLDDHLSSPSTVDTRSPYSAEVARHATPYGMFSDPSPTLAGSQYQAPSPPIVSPYNDPESDKEHQSIGGKASLTTGWSRRYSLRSVGGEGGVVTVPRQQLAGVDHAQHEEQTEWVTALDNIALDDEDNKEEEEEELGSDDNMLGGMYN